MYYIDLTHTLDSRSPSWNGSCGYHLDVKMKHSQGCLVHQIKAHAGIGTHMDAPLHFFEHGQDIASLALENLIGPLICIHAPADRGENFVFTKKDLDAWENQFGKVSPGSFVLIHSGWDKRWPSDSYRNVQANQRMLFPSVGEDVAKILLERQIKGLGVDTLSPDLPGSNFAVHHTLLGAGKIIIENLTNLTKVPPTGAKFFALPPKWSGASEAPIRALAFLGFAEHCPE